ncbi:MAG: UDP-N-acetylmuramoyl-L-alanine--D-glutamate ligase [Alphaproteobacteria bacterium]|nr:UDP-N-acetylmuramoyl-L-alanine--D-glutamate ligase [Alphaproteobacteria bacterium]
MITLPGIEGQSYAVLGLGKSGLSVAASLRASKAKPVLWDDNPTARAEAEKADFAVVDLATANPKDFQALVLSPGIPHTHPAPHSAVVKFRAAGVPIIGDIELLFRASPQATFVGITGTNGKSTTTALIGHILKSARRKLQVGGNLGTPALSLEPLGADGIYVLELSSYQLELIQQNLLKVAVLLNITPDHIDRHGGMEGYIAAKARIFETNTPQTLVIGTDEPETRALVLQARQKKNLHIEEISVQHPVAHGVMVAGQQMFSYTGEEEGGLITNLGTLPTLPGKHNWQNACAAFAACRALDVPTKQIVQGLKTFPGLAHRQQLVAEIEGVRFINDSKATNADATGKALACYDNIYWIIGGQAKEGGLKGLEEFGPRIRHAFIIGEASENFASWCQANHLAHTLCGTLDIAVQKAAATAWKDKKPGAVVLLSPACASWDQFSNFEERGRMFTKFVETLSSVPQAKVLP